MDRCELGRERDKTWFYHVTPSDLSSRVRFKAILALHVVKVHVEHFHLGKSRQTLVNFGKSSLLR